MVFSLPKTALDNDLTRTESLCSVRETADDPPPAGLGLSEGPTWGTSVRTCQGGVQVKRHHIHLLAGSAPFQTVLPKQCRGITGPREPHRGAWHSL